jgi:D-inositol-3-phosphate glycosyltransferase
LDHPGRTKDAGGMNVYMRELAQKMAKHHMQVDIFTRRTDQNTPQIVHLGKNTRVIHVQAGPMAPLHKNDLYQYTPTFARYIGEFRRNESIHYDLIHSHYWLSGVAATRLACHWGVPHVTMFHTLGRLKQLANPKEPELPLRLEMEQRLIRHVDCIIAPTPEERNQMIRYCGAIASRIAIIPCGVDLKLFVPLSRSYARQQLGLPAGRPMLLFAGRLDPFKGPDLLLRASALMQKEALVVIVGGSGADDNDTQQLRGLAQHLGVADRVLLLGARPREEMPLFYNAANITVVPSYHETFGLAAVESLACGTPVVATRAGGLTAIVRHGENGFLVPRCPGFFAERLDALLSDDQLYTCLQSAARSSVTQFSWEKVAQEVHTVYQELTSEELSRIAQ